MDGCVVKGSEDGCPIILSSWSGVDGTLGGGGGCGGIGFPLLSLLPIVLRSY